jgi:hypothetical protein
MWRDIVSRPNGRSGYVVLIDGRTPTPDGDVPPSDVIGVVDVDAGDVVADSYQHNSNHQLLTTNGFFVLPPELETVLQNDLRNLCRQQVVARNEDALRDPDQSS